MEDKIKNMIVIFYIGLILFSSGLVSATTILKEIEIIANDSIAEDFKTEFEQMCPGNWSYQTTIEGFIEGVVPADKNTRCLIKTKPSLFIDKLLEQFSTSFGVPKDQLKFSDTFNLKNKTVFEYQRKINDVEIVNSFINFRFFPTLILEKEASALVGEQQEEKIKDIYLVRVSARLYPNISEKFETKPKISEEQLKQIIEKEKEKRRLDSYNFENEGLFILPTAFVAGITTPKLAYNVSITKPATLYSFTYYIDAMSGEVLIQFSDVKSPISTLRPPVLEITPPGVTPPIKTSQQPIRSLNYFWSLILILLVLISIVVVFYIYKKKKYH